MHSIKWVQSVDKTGWTAAETALLMALVLRDRNPKHPAVVWPTITTLCHDTGLSRRGVQKALRSLQWREVLQIEARGSQSNVYTLLVGGEHCAPGGEQNDTQGANSVHPEVEVEGEVEGKETLSSASDDGEVVDWMNRLGLRETGMRAEDVLRQHEQPEWTVDKLVDYYRDRKKPRQMGYLWRALVAHCYPDMQPTVPLTGKQEAYMGRLLKHVDDLPDRLGRTVENWRAFARYIQNAAGLNGSPNRPRLDFLYTYRQEWIAFTNEDDWTEPVQSIAPVTPTHMVDPSPSPEEDQPQSVDDLFGD